MQNESLLDFAELYLVPRLGILKAGLQETCDLDLKADLISRAEEVGQTLREIIKIGHLGPPKKKEDLLQRVDEISEVLTEVLDFVNMKGNE
ncbi:MAG: hypothetical protein GY847_01690 [Proteobacteria bacterium]|nr:hypothetical protein [Pseudomonadota bacterium]